MISKLRIKNFQSHQDTLLEFSNGVNVIVPQDISNPSTIGKTSIKRALELLIFNRPGGAKFFSNFAGNKGVTEIAIETSEGHEVSFSKQVNIKGGVKEIVDAEYVLNGQVFKKFGASVPDEISSIINMGDLNFQEQLDKPFLISATAGNIAKTINRITKAENVDRWTSELTSRINSKNKEAKLIQEDVKDIEQRLERLKGIDEVEKAINKMIIADNKMEVLTGKVERIQELMDEIVSYQAEIKRLIKVKEVEKSIADLEKLEIKIEKQIVKENLLIDFIEANSALKKLVDVDVSKQIKQVEKIVKEIDIKQIQINQLYIFVDVNIKYNKLKKVDVTDPLKKLEQVFKDIEGRIESKYEVNAFVDYSNYFDKVKKIFDSRKEEYNNLLKKLGRCPTCFTKLDDKKINEIMKGV